jgi:GxxExxY protein
MELLLKEEVYSVIGAAIEVHKEMGPGFLEPVYQECLEFELAKRRVPFRPQADVKIRYKEHPLKKKYTADFIVNDKMIVEIKAENSLTPKDQSQLINYLKATRLKVGLLINFGSHGKLEWKRMVL